MKAKYIYILKLESKKWYIGISENIENRINNHIKGKGSRWTNKYKPLKLIKSYKIKDLHDEDKVTIEYMEKYGIINVRGGTFCECKFSKFDTNKVFLLISLFKLIFNVSEGFDLFEAELR